MREILFRGKRIDNGVRVEGDLIQLHDGRMYIVNNVHGACIDDKGNFINTEEPFVCAVDPATVGQFTGLVDKNGKRIFEGDIVECWSEGVCARGTVQQRKDGMWIIYPAWQKYIMWSLCPDDYLQTTVEIIGNIHDNPELVEGTENG